MTTTEYQAQNAKGYEGDSYIGKEIEKLVKQFAIDQIIETGTYYGATTAKLAEMAPVLSVEINVEHWRRARQNLSTKQNVQLELGNSVDILNQELPKLNDKKILFFLDAHWENYCPLCDELKLIAEHGIKPIIVIHDFQVPDRPYGYDSYKGQAFTYEWIKPQLDAIYGEVGYHHYYNEIAEGAKRGVIYIIPV